MKFDSGKFPKHPVRRTLANWLACCTALGVLIGSGRASEEAPSPAAIPAPPAQAELDVQTQSHDLGGSLMRACWKGDLPEATRLINAGAPIECRDSLLRTPLFLACHGSPDIVKLLLAHGARVGVVDKDGNTTIGRACEFGDLESAKLVLAAGADMNLENKGGRTPLMLAAGNGHDALVAFLLAQHVDVNHAGKSLPALFYAAWQDHPAIAKMLLDAGAIASQPASSLTNDTHGNTLIGLAACTNDLSLVDLLLAHGANINETDKMGLSVLMAALQQGDNPTTITHLLEKGANINAQNNDGQTPLMLAINYQPVSVLGDLLNHGARLETKDKRGRTALIWAALFALEDQTHFLVEHGADLNAADNTGETALTYAGDCGAMGLVDYLKEKGAKRTDIHIIQRDSPTPPLSLSESWALAVGAIYTQRNGENPHVLGYDTNALEPEEAERELKDEWNITNKGQLLRELEILRASGDRMDLQKLGARLAAMTDSEFDAVLNGPDGANPERNARLKAARATYHLWKDRSGLAFDLCRRAHMICMGFAAGYITANEAWPLLLENARTVQAGFHSWREMGNNFLDGRESGEGERDSRFGDCTRLLLNPKDPNSPWNQLPWNTDLGAADAGAPAESISH